MDDFIQLLEKYELSIATLYEAFASILKHEIHGAVR